MTQTPTTTPAQPEALRLADALASNYFDGKQGRDVWDAAAAELRRLHAQVAALTAAQGVQAELENLRLLAATCYAGLGANLPENWLDALNAAANGEPFSVEGLLPFTATLAQPAEGDPDPADIIAGALQTSRGHAIEMMRAAVADLPAEGAAYAELPDQVAWRDSTYHCDLYYQPTYREGLAPLFTADQLRDFADRTHALRASHGQAPAGATLVYALCESLEDQNAGATEFERGMRTAAKRIRKEFGANIIPTAQPAPAAGAVVGPVDQWQKRHPTKTEGKWENTNEADAKWWRENSPGWEVRALYAAAPTPAAQQGDAEDAALWRTLTNLPGARRRIWNHVLDDDAKGNANSIEEALRAALAQKEGKV